VNLLGQLADNCRTLTYFIATALFSTDFADKLRTNEDYLSAEKLFRKLVEEAETRPPSKKTEVGLSV
jgi:hypothetical protein